MLSLNGQNQIYVNNISAQEHCNDNNVLLSVSQVTNFFSVILKVFVIDLTGILKSTCLLTGEKKKTAGAMKLWGQDQHWIGLNNLDDGKYN